MTFRVQVISVLHEVPRHDVVVLLDELTDSRLVGLDWLARLVDAGPRLDAVDDVLDGHGRKNFGSTRAWVIGLQYLDCVSDGQAGVEAQLVAEHDRIGCVPWLPVRLRRTGARDLNLHGQLPASPSSASVSVLTTMGRNTPPNSSGS